MSSTAARRLARIALINIVIIAFLLAAIEVIFRFVQIPRLIKGDTAELENFFVPDPAEQGFWVTNPKLAGPRPDPKMRELGDNHRVFWSRFNEIKAPDVYRIFVIGSSPIYGSSLPSWFNLSTHLAARLYEIRPDVRFEIIDASREEMNGEELESVAGEVVKFESDLTIIYPGGASPNLEMDDMHSVIGLESDTPKIFRFLWKSALIRFAVELYGHLHDEKSAGMRLVNSPDQQNLVLIRLIKMMRERETESYKGFLTRFVKAFHDRKRRLILMTTATMVSDFEVIWSVHLKKLTNGQLKEFARLLAYGKKLVETKQTAQAREVLEKALRISDTYAMLHYLIGKNYQNAGQYKEARQAYGRAEILDASHERTFAEPINLIFQVGAKFGVEVVDSENLLASQISSGLVGSEFFRDHTHLTPFGLAILAKDLCERITKTLPQPADGPPQPPPLLPYYSMMKPEYGIYLYGRSDELQPGPPSGEPRNGPPATLPRDRPPPAKEIRTGALAH